MIILMRDLYKRLWMPLFGRLLSIFVPLIEGKQSEQKSSYKFKKDNEPR